MEPYIVRYFLGDNSFSSLFVVNVSYFVTKRRLLRRKKNVLIDMAVAGGRHGKKRWPACVRTRDPKQTLRKKGEVSHFPTRKLRTNIIRVRQWLFAPVIHTRLFLPFVLVKNAIVKINLWTVEVVPNIVITSHRSENFNNVDPKQISCWNNFCRVTDVGSVRKVREIRGPPVCVLDKRWTLRSGSVG